MWFDDVSNEIEKRKNDDETGGKEQRVLKV